MGSPMSYNAVMKQWGGALILLAVIGGRAEDLPSARASTSADRNGGETRRTFPFGEITLHLEEAPAPTASPPRPGHRHAETRGRFTLTYELIPRGRAIVVKRLSVKNVNVEIYHSSPTVRLRDHEAMHRRINEVEAKKIEHQLRGFTAPDVSAAEAERRLLQQFQKELDRVRRRHEEWDENDVFVSPAKEPTP